MINLESVLLRKTKPSDKDWIDIFITEHWCSNFVVAHGCKYFPGKLQGFAAGYDYERIGLITYQIKNFRCEIVTLNSVIEGKGVGTKLMNLAEREAVKNKCKAVWLITTNDNLRAIKFYEKLGYRLVKVHQNAVEYSRKIKPDIPLIGENGIPIKDELEFLKNIEC